MHEIMSPGVPAMILGAVETVLTFFFARSPEAPNTKGHRG